MPKLSNPVQFLMKRISGNSIIYRRSFIVALLITCMPAALIGFIIYIFGSSQIAKEVQHNHRNQLMQAAERIDNTFGNLEIIFSKWAFNPIFGEQLRDTDLQKQYDVTHNLYTTMAVIKESDSLVGQAVLYLEGPSVVLSDDMGIEPIGETISQQKYEQLLRQSRAVFWTDLLAGVSGLEGTSPYSLVIRLPGGGTRPFGALILYLDSARVGELIDGNLADDGRASILMDEDGGPVSARRDETAEQSALEQELRSVVAKKSGDRETFLMEWNKKTYSVSYDRFRRLGSTWIYVTATPLSQLVAPVRLLSRLVIGISLAGTVIAVVLAWLASNQLNRPVRLLLSKIERMAPEGKTPDTNFLTGKDEFAMIEQQWMHLTRESQILQRRLDRHLPALREGFLLQLVQGHLFSLSEKELRERMGQLGWAVDNQRYAIVLLQLQGFTHLAGRFSEGDEQLVTFAAANITGELAASRMAYVDLINFQDLTIGLLIRFPAEQAELLAKAKLHQLADVLMTSVDKVLHMQLTIVIGKLTDTVQEIPAAFADARRTLRYRDVQKDNQILDVSELLPQGKQAVNYPFAIEKEMIQALRMGMEDDCFRLTGRFVQELQNQSGKEVFVKLGMLQLLGNVQNAILQSGYNVHELYGQENMFEQLNSFNEPLEMLKWFDLSVIRPYVRALLDSRNVEMKLLVEKAMLLLQERYSDEISLEWCADQLDTYPQKLSTGFKQITGLNFIDYLTELRLEKAKEMLRDTDDKMIDIAKRVGYQPSYFNRLFKKREGITPGLFREMIRKKEK